MLGDIMVDIETMGNGSRSALVQLAAQEFDVYTGTLGKSFNRVISLQSCLDAGLFVNGSTIEWWMGQSDEARKRIFQDPVHLFQALHEFTEFVNECGGQNARMWGNSPRFDQGIIADAYRAAGKALPWNFRLERDVRTISAQAPQFRRDEPLPAVLHDGIEDSKYQISYLCKIVNALNIRFD